MSRDELRLKHIERMLVMRWWIFSVIGFALILNAAAVFLNYNSIGRLEDSQRIANVRSLNNTAAVDSLMRQMLIYQQQTVQYWDKLSKDNPKVKVPRVTVKPVVAIPPEPLSDSELTRLTAPKPTPIPVKAHKPKPKPTPTPQPFKWPWSNPSKTR
jgi:hypothetical protein